MLNVAARIESQRKIIESVNSRYGGEPLYGLTQGAIARWRHSHQSPAEASAEQLLIEAGTCLRSLADKSLALEGDEAREFSDRLSAIVKRIQELG
jgi:hypothetical protein